MLPSSRTPEGSPVDCPTCGKSSWMEYSIPPGDVTCPHCGSLVWRKRPKAIDRTEEFIRANVNWIATLTQRAVPIPEFEPMMLKALVNSLAAHTGSVWTLDPETGFFGSPRLRVESTLWEGYEGLSDTMDLLIRTFREGQPCVKSIEHGGRGYFVLMAPVKKDDRVCRVIEVYQRQTDNSRAVRGYLQFMIQVAEIVASHPSLAV